MSTAVATQAPHYTPEDLLAMPDGKSYELVDGQLVERKMGADSSEVGGNLYFQLRLFCRERDLGRSLAGRQRLPLLPSRPQHGPQT